MIFMRIRIWILEPHWIQVISLRFTDFFLIKQNLYIFCPICSFIFIQLLEDLVSSYRCIDGRLSGKTKNRTTNHIISCKGGPLEN